MTRLRALDPARHGALRLDRARGAAARRLVPVGRSEIALAAADMPLLLAKDGQTGRFELVALVGLVEPVNLFVSPAGYHATSQPQAAGLTALRLDPEGADGLAVDEADASLGAAGEALFEYGRAEHWRRALEAALADVTAGRALAEGYARRGVLRPLSVTLTMADGHEQMLDGLYGIAEAALAELADADVVAMHRADELAPATVLTASLAQVERLRQLHNARFSGQIAAIGLGIAD
ncbi:SapC family protein [uncultured Sphingomonas sp.]|uniref:SapC family protein n=1 Tax=uncultured Sphingomonas sp. TaxID=158754 RepID=UPI0030F4DB9D